MRCAGDARKSDLKLKERQTDRQRGTAQGGHETKLLTRADRAETRY